MIVEAGMQHRHFGERTELFLSEEFTAWFRDSPQAVRLLCVGMTIYDQGWLERHSGDVEVCAAYLKEHGIACELAQVPAPLTQRQQRRLAELFPLWSRAAA